VAVLKGMRSISFGLLGIDELWDSWPERDCSGTLCNMKPFAYQNASKPGIALKLHLEQFRKDHCQQT
jgi:hypothetical protein